MINDFENNKLVKQFNNFTVDTLPHAIILSGEYGCGKHRLTKLIAEQFNLKLVDIEDKINYELLEELNNSIEPLLCLIDGNKITLKEEAVLLKFIEEPRKNIFNVICCESTANVLDTILNRCQLFTFEEYSKEILSSIYDNFYEDKTNKDLIISIANTPGKLKNWCNVNFLEEFDYCNKILDFINKAKLSNLFNISNKISFDNNEIDKYNIDSFLAILLYVAEKRTIENKPFASQQYFIIKDLVSEMKIPNINKTYLFENYLFKLRGVVNEAV